MACSAPSHCPNQCWNIVNCTLWTSANENSIEIYTFSFKKIHLKMLSGKWRPFRLGLNVLKWCDMSTKVSQITDNFESSCHWWIPLTHGQKFCGKCFHVMTSSWSKALHLRPDLNYLIPFLRAHVNHSSLMVVFTLADYEFAWFNIKWLIESLSLSMSYCKQKIAIIICIWM